MKLFVFSGFGIPNIKIKIRNIALMLKSEGEVSEAKPADLVFFYCKLIFFDKDNLLSWFSSWEKIQSWEYCKMLKKEYHNLSSFSFPDFELAVSWIFSFRATVNRGRSPGGEEGDIFKDLVRKERFL